MSKKYNISDDGLKYFFHTKADTSNLKAEVGSIMVLDMKYYTHSYYEDSLLFNSRELPSVYRIKLRESPCETKTCIEDAFAMMRVGDSASFIISADNFYRKTQRIPIPRFLYYNDSVRFEVKLVDIQTEEQVEEERKVFAIRKKAEEIELLKEYLSKNYPEAKPYPSGLYHITKKEGNGDKPQENDYISIHYVGKKVNGEIFYSTVEKREVFSFTNHSDDLILGLQEAIDSMRLGEIATFILPSDIAFGEKGASKIPPFTTLIFEIELLNIARY